MASGGSEARQATWSSWPGRRPERKERVASSDDGPHYVQEVSLKGLKRGGESPRGRRSRGHHEIPSPGPPVLMEAKRLPHPALEKIAVDRRSVPPSHDESEAGGARRRFPAEPPPNHEMPPRPATARTPGSGKIFPEAHALKPAEGGRDHGKARYGRGTTASASSGPFGGVASGPGVRRGTSYARGNRSFSSAGACGVERFVWAWCEILPCSAGPVNVRERPKRESAAGSAGGTAPFGRRFPGGVSPWRRGFAVGGEA